MPSPNPLRNLPKVELHRHLDGSLRTETISDIARRHSLDIGAGSLEELRKKAMVTSPLRDLKEVLACFATIQKVLCSFEAISRVCFENIEDAHRDGVKLLELRFAPSFIARGKNLQNDLIIEAVLDGLVKGLARYPIEAGLIVILPRSQPLELNARVTRDLIRWKRNGLPGADRICGFDLADQEAGVDPGPLTRLVEDARAAGLGITIHSGEDTDAAHVARTLDLFKPARIGHGIKAWGHDDVMRRLIESDVLLEVCPTSNWITRAVPSLASHPLPGLYRAGVPVSLNSDDPNFFGIDLVHEYEVCRREYGFTDRDFATLNRAALDHSFLPAETREKIRREHFA